MLPAPFHLFIIAASGEMPNWIRKFGIARKNGKSVKKPSLTSDEPCYAVRSRLWPELDCDFAVANRDRGVADDLRSDLCGGGGEQRQRKEQAHGRRDENAADDVSRNLQSWAPCDIAANFSTRLNQRRSAPARGTVLSELCCDDIKSARRQLLVFRKEHRVISR